MIAPQFKSPNDHKQSGLLVLPAGDPGAAAHGFLTLLDRALAFIPDPWTVLLLREAFLGNQKFDRLQKVTGMPRQTLHQRLKRLCENEILQQVPYQERPPRYAYRLSERGRALHGYALAVWRWQNRWYPENHAMPAALIHSGCGEKFHPDFICARCRMPVTWQDVALQVGRHRVRFQRGPARNPRWVGNAERRPSLAKAQLRPGTYILADRWCCLIIAASFLGLRHFDQLTAVLGIATNILSARLQALREAGIFTASEYSQSKGVFEFSPTEKCLEFLPLLLALISWANLHLVPGKKAPVILHHTVCGGTLLQIHACDFCGSVLSPQDVRFVPHPN